MKWLVLSLLFCAALYAEPPKVKQATGSVIRTKGKIQTGSSSRIELELPYFAIVRVGSNAELKFSPDFKKMSLESGAMLFTLPAKTDGISIESGSTITSLVRGDLQMSNVAGQVKVIVLNGRVATALAVNPSDRRSMRSGDSVTVPPGATSMPPIVAIKLAKLLKTSILFNMGPLPTSRAIRQNATQQAPPSIPIFVTGGFDPDWGGGGAGSLLTMGPPGTAAMVRLIEAGKPEPLPVVPPGELPTKSQAEIFAAAGKPVPNVTTQEGRRILRGDRLRVLRDRLRPPMPVVTPAPTPQPTRPPVIRPPIATPRPTLRPPIAPP